MIEYVDITREYQSEHGPVTAVNGVSLRVEAGEICVLLGPSGCGKTTLLRMTNRLIEPTSGTLHIQGRNILDENPVELRRRIGYVIQSIGLFPHRTVGENIGTTLKLLNKPAQHIDERVDELLAMMQLETSYRNRYPAELSGGEQQRIGVARALAADPPLLLMDEPFGAIDPINRAEIQQQFLSLQQTLRKTIIFVSHDITEALLFADKIALMQQGRLVQYGTPEELLTNPATDFVSRFFGEHPELLLLNSLSISEVMANSDHETVQDSIRYGRTIHVGNTARDGLMALLTSGASQLTVIDDQQEPLGSITFDTISNALHERTGGRNAG